MAGALHAHMRIATAILNTITDELGVTFVFYTLERTNAVSSVYG